MLAKEENNEFVNPQLGEAYQMLAKEENNEFVNPQLGDSRSPMQFSPTPIMRLYGNGIVCHSLTVDEALRVVEAHGYSVLQAHKHISSHHIENKRITLVSRMPTEPARDSDQWETCETK